MAKLIDNKDIATVEEFDSLEERIQSVHETVNAKVDKLEQKIDGGLSAISEELKKKLSEELLYEVDEEKIVGSVLSKVVVPIPKDGEDYILTNKDKQEIAQSITIPVVEKIIERTEVIHETPIVTEVVKQVAVTDTPEAIRNKLESLEGDERLNIDAIRDLDERLDEIEKEASKQKVINNYSQTSVKSSGGITKCQAIAYAIALS